MFKWIAFLFISVPILELWGLITVGKWIGLWPTLALVFLTGVVGAWLAKHEGLQTLRLVQLQLSRGELPGQAVLDGICILFGGAVLLTPGFFTDIVGFLLLLPYTRNWFKALLKRTFDRWIQTGKFVVIRKE
jgi:UPF0716 protein FxsA